jgi:hypothetical protein
MIRRHGRRRCRGAAGGCGGRHGLFALAPWPRVLGLGVGSGSEVVGEVGVIKGRRWRHVGAGIVVAGGICPVGCLLWCGCGDVMWGLEPVKGMSC